MVAILLAKVKCTSKTFSGDTHVLYNDTNSFRLIVYNKLIGKYFNKKKNQRAFTKIWLFFKNNNNNTGN